MTTIYVFELEDNKYYISEFKNEVIEPIKELINKLVSDTNSEQSKSLLTQNLGATISSIEWIKKYPIKTIAEIKENANLEKISIYYIKEYGLDNVRSDMCKDIELKEEIVKYIQNILNNSDAPVPVRIKLIDHEINKLKSTFDFIDENNKVIDKYLKYSLNVFVQQVQQKLQQQQNLNQQQLQQLQQQQQQLQFQQQIQQQILQIQQQMHLQQAETSQIIKKLCDQQINILIPNFIDAFIKSLKQESPSNSPRRNKFTDLTNSDNSTKIKSLLEDYFSNHKIIEEIANTLLLQKKNQKLTSKYGTLEEINKQLTSLLYRKIDLINMLEMDDIEEEEYVDNDEEEDDDDDEEDEDDEDDDDDEDNKCEDCGESTVQLVMIDNKPTLKCTNCD